MSLKVTFDSNVWEDVVVLDRLSDRPERHRLATRVRKSIERGEIVGFFSETWATLEGIEKDARPDFFTKQNIEPRLIETVWPDGSTTLGVMAGPNQSHRPPLSPVVWNRLEAAITLGLRLLIGPRYHELSLPADFFAEQTAEIALRTSLVLEAIRSRGVGEAKIRKFGLSVAMAHGFSGVSSEIPPVELKPDESRKLAALIAEWADGDAIAAHYGYANDVFCTEDYARSAKGASVFDESNRGWLAQQFGIRFVCLAELAEMVRE
jgi:hypothetical protein